MGVLRGLYKAPRLYLYFGSADFNAVGLRIGYLAILWILSIYGGWNQLLWKNRALLPEKSDRHVMQLSTSQKVPAFSLRQPLSYQRSKLIHHSHSLL